MNGIRAALAAQRLDFDSCTQSLDHLHVRAGDFEYGRALATTFASSPNRPTAFLALNDEIGVGALHGFQASRLRVPHDLSISGFNNQDICAMTTPGLTSVDQQIARTVAAAAKLIFEHLNGPARRRPVLRTLVPELVTRGAPGPAPA